MRSSYSPGREERHGAARRSPARRLPQSIPRCPRPCGARGPSAPVPRPLLRSSGCSLRSARPGHVWGKAAACPEPGAPAPAPLCCREGAGALGSGRQRGSGGQHGMRGRRLRHADQEPSRWFPGVEGTGLQRGCFLRTGQYNYGVSLPGERCIWSFALSANWPYKQKAPLQQRFPIFFPLAWGLGAPLAVLQRV